MGEPTVRQVIELAEGQLNVDHVGRFVTVVEIDRGPNNFFDRELIDRLADLLEDLATTPSVRVVVLASRGKHFCAGARLASAQDDDRDGTYERHLYDAASRLMRQPLPIVAAVHGRAVGGGFGLAMACDFRVAATDAVFDSAFARLGIHHGFGLTVTLPDAIGAVRARRILYQQVRVPAEEALQIGLCEELASAAELRETAIEFASSIAASAPLAVRAIRATMRQALVASYDAAVQRERMAQTLLRGTADATEGIAAQRERREPVYRGR